jgi:hypothetical protein
MNPRDDGADGIRLAYLRCGVETMRGFRLLHDVASAVFAQRPTARTVTDAWDPAQYLQAEADELGEQVSSRLGSPDDCVPLARALSDAVLAACGEARPSSSCVHATRWGVVFEAWDDLAAFESPLLPWEALGLSPITQD